MTEPDPWVAYLPLPRGYLMMEPADDRHPPEKYRTRYRSGPESCLVTSTAELGAVLVRAGTTLGQVAKERPDYLAYLLFSLTGRDPYSLVRESTWRDLELYCHLDRTTNLPAVRNSTFEFLAYTRYMPRFEIHRMTLDLTSLELADTLVVDCPWPPQNDNDGAARID